ncbi:hypothetical protein KAR91_79165 [Candidatus Pacearchaeota archaeon]|nr:hypothetical protein [Candidatus Pacearchaeota archaeon]
MKIFDVPLKVQKHGRGGAWERGVIIMPSEHMDHFDWKPQQIVLIAARMDEEITDEKISEVIKEYHKSASIETEMKKLKDDVKHDFND